MPFLRFLILFWESPTIGLHACKKCFRLLKINITSKCSAKIQSPFLRAFSVLIGQMAQSVVIGLPRATHVRNNAPIAIVPYFWHLIENINLSDLLFIILTGCDSVEPAGPNKLGTEPSFKSKGFVNPMINSPRLEKQLLCVNVCVWGWVNLFAAI